MILNLEWHCQLKMQKKYHLIVITNILKFMFTFNPCRIKETRLFKYVFKNGKGK